MAKPAPTAPRRIVLTDTPKLAAGPYRRDIPYAIPADVSEELAAHLVAHKGFRYLEPEASAPTTEESI